MSRLGFMNRVRSWFGGKGDVTDAVGASSKRWSLPSASAPSLALGASGAAAAVRESAPATCSDIPHSPDSASAAIAMARSGADRASGAPTEMIDPLDPEWLKSFEDLPQRIAESVAAQATGPASLEQVEYELEGHRQTSRAIMDAVRRLPDLAASQADLARKTNAILERECHLTESLIDGVAALRAALRGVDESSKRHLVAIEQLEESHREVLREYQAVLLKAHRRLGRSVAMAMLLAAAALGGIGYLAWRMFFAS